MHVHVYLIDLEDNDCAALELAINEIVDRIPCFTNIRPIASTEVDLMEFMITCMDYDVPFVETMLAPFV